MNYKPTESYWGGAQRLASMILLSCIQGEVRIETDTDECHTGVVG